MKAGKKIVIELSEKEAKELLNSLAMKMAVEGWDMKSFQELYPTQVKIMKAIREQLTKEG